MNPIEVKAGVFIFYTPRPVSLVFPFVTFDLSIKSLFHVWLIHVAIQIHQIWSTPFLFPSIENFQQGEASLCGHQFQFHKRSEPAVRTAAGYDNMAAGPDKAGWLTRRRHGSAARQVFEQQQRRSIYRTAGLRRRTVSARAATHRSLDRGQ